MGSVAPFVSSHGTEFSWGTCVFSLTSLSVAVSSDDIDISSMSSEVRRDDENTNRKLLVRDYDSGVAADVEISIDFLAGTWLNEADAVTKWPGLQRTLLVAIPGDINDDGSTTAGFFLRKSAIMQRMSINASTGEFVRGNATFRLS